MVSGNLIDSAARALQQGDNRKAIEYCDALLAALPDDADALHLRGLAYHMGGNHEAAADSLLAAARRAPNDPVLLGNLGRVLATVGRYSEAADCFRDALRLRPDEPADLEDLATAVCCLGRYEEGCALFERALASSPRRSSTLLKLARARLHSGDSAAALELSTRALEADVACAPKAWTTRGLALLANGRFPDAIAAFSQAVALDPAAAEAWQGRTHAYRRTGQLALARADAETAVRLQPADADAGVVLGGIEAERGDHSAAVAAYERVLVAHPKNLRALWARAMAVPVVFESEAQLAEERAGFQARIAALEADLRLATPDDVEAAVAGLKAANNFNLNYDGCDDRSLQESYGRIVHRIACARYPQFAHPPAPRRGRGPRSRVGFLTRFLGASSLWKTHGAWVQEASGDFEKHLYYTGLELASDAEIAARGMADIFVHEPNVDRLITLIAAHDLDVLIYLDHGVRVDLQIPAALWLARVQCNGLAHPITSGLPTLGYAISSELMEPDDGHRHYAEQLVKLPNTASCYRLDRIRAALARIGPVERSSSTVRFLCSQNLRKYLPQHDRVFADIARELPTAKFHFIADTDHVTAMIQRRLRGAFAARGVDADRACRFHPAMSMEDYFRLNLSCDVFLDSMLWSGNNTAHEAIACGLPIVTLPGPMMRGRHCLGLLQRLGLMDTVAGDVDGYVGRAVGLARDAEWRRHLRNEMVGRLDRVFDDLTPVRALENFLQEWSSSRAA